MKREWKYAFFSPGFAAAVLVTALTFLLGLAEEDLPNHFRQYDLLYMFNLCMQLSPVLVFLPLAATLPYGFRFIDEYNSCYFRFSLSRSSYRRYALCKTAAVTGSAFSATFLGLSLAAVLLAIAAKPMDAADPGFSQLFETLKEGRTYGGLLEISVPLYMAVSIFFMSLFACLWPCVGMITSTYIKNRYVSLVMPFAAFFLVWQISNRTAYLVPALSGYLTIANVYYGSVGLFEDPWLSAGVTLLFALVWQALLYLWFSVRIRKCS